jgi:magnesium transporter
MWFLDGENFALSAEQVSLILGPSYVITFQEKTEDIFDSIRKRIRSGGPRFRGGGPDYLAYALLDIIVDNYFIILERLDGRIESLEETSITSLGRETLQEIHQLRRALISLARSIWPLREVLGRLEREDFPLIQESTQKFLRDVSDHTIQVIETIETFRDRVSGVRDIYLSMLSNNMNAIMKFLTIIGTIFIPLTFIAGVYGMNFKNMPELEWKWGYPVSLGVMAFAAIGMLVYFWRKKWF